MVIFSTGDCDSQTIHHQDLREEFRYHPSHSKQDLGGFFWEWNILDGDGS